MEIPIRNIYYLLCYAWDKLEERDVVDVNAIESASLLDLFARVLINGTRHLVRRGFDRGYVTHHEDTRRPRGRILFQETVARNLLHVGRLPCQTDELSHDVLHNRILKATIRRLLAAQDLSGESVDSLAQLYRQLVDVTDVRLTAQMFGQVQLHRNNSFYEFLLKVSEVIFHNLLVAEGTGAAKFVDFVRDERQMRVLFENFVRNFFDHESDFQVGSEEIRWNWIAADPASLELLPKMQTDVSLTKESRKIIIECKFTARATERHHWAEADKLRPEHLYQLHAYLKNVPVGPHAEKCEGILLYPTVGPPISADYSAAGNKIRVRTINLNQPWQLIHTDLLDLVAQ